MNKFILICFCATILVACKSASDNQKSFENPELTFSGDTVRIPAQSTIGQRIRQLTVTAETVQVPYSTTASVRAIPECIAEVAVPFDGRIVESFIKTGQTVKAGSPLFSIHSPEFFETVKAFLQARQEKQVAELNQSRQQDLVEHGVGIQKELDEARLALEIAKGQYDNLKATLAIYNVNSQDAEVGKPMIVTSPIKGEVVRNSIRVGQYLKSDSESMVCIADLRKVWIIAQVKESRIGLIQMQDEVKITTDAFPKGSFSGFVSYIGKILDEQSRSLEIIIECDNSDQLLRPGMFATVTFIHAQQEGIIIPATALIQGESGTYLYKHVSGDIFIRTMVQTTTAGEGKAMVQAGVSVGDRIISEGSIYLQ